MREAGRCHLAALRCLFRPNGYEGMHHDLISEYGQLLVLKIGHFTAAHLSAIMIGIVVRREDSCRDNEIDAPLREEVRQHMQE